LTGSLAPGRNGFGGGGFASVAQCGAAAQAEGTWHVKKVAVAVALCGRPISSPVQAKTFVGVLWPMFGPLAAPGLAELVAELKTMPDVEVRTYLHESWPSLVEDIDRQPPGTRTVVVGYSLGANSSVFVANKAKYVDLVVALQPSMLSWNPPLTGKVGRMIEIYNPNPLLTFGGMGSKKLTGGTIEYITNNDSHPGAQFSAQFRNVVKGGIARLTAQDRVEVAQATARRDRESRLASAEQLASADEQSSHQQKDLAAPQPPAQEPTGLSSNVPRERTDFLDALSAAVNSGDLSVTPQLTAAAMLDHARRIYGAPRGDMIASAFSGNGAL
jgi:hypothetical protein